VFCKITIHEMQRSLQHVYVGNNTEYRSVHCTKTVFTDENLRFVDAKLQKGLAVVLFGHAPFVLCGVCGCLPLVALAGTQLAFLALQQEEGAIANCAITLRCSTLKTNIETMPPFVVVVAVRVVRIDDRRRPIPTFTADCVILIELLSELSFR